MATKLEPDFPSSPPNDESEGEDQLDETVEEHEIKQEKGTVNNNVQDILKRLQSSGALIKKPKQEYVCLACDIEYPDWEELENHLIQHHVSLPSVVIDKLPSDEEDIPQSGDEDWSDEEDSPPPVQAAPKTPQKIDISKILKNSGISLKKSTEPSQSSGGAAIDKLSGLGFTIKKTSTPIKNEPEVKIEPAQEKNNAIMQKLGQLGGIKLKLKSDGNNSNSFKVVNGLKDFKTSDDEDEDDDVENDSKNIGSQEGESDEEQNKSGDQEGSGGDNFSDEETPINDQQTGTPQKQTNVATKTAPNTLKQLQGKTINTQVEITKSPAKSGPLQTLAKEPAATRPPGRPNIKQTPKRGANLPLTSKELPKNSPTHSSVSSNSTPERRISHDTSAENVVIKKEVDLGEPQSGTTNVPLFSGQIKSERTSPTPSDQVTPMIANVKSEPETLSITQTQSLFSSQPHQTVASDTTTRAEPLLPVTKTEEIVTIIEINGDSNDEDDDCCVVSATPAPDIKPVVPKTEPLQQSYPPPAYPITSQSSYSSSLPPSLNRPSTLEKQHNFNWNAPDSKPVIDILEKSTDDMFENLLSSSTKKEALSLSDASEYISLDTLGPQHSCEICNTRFTDIMLLEDHRRITGHSKSLVLPSSTSSLLPYNPSSSNILQSLLPVKQMVEQVGKLSGIGSGPGFTHQQNVMINIQAYPGGGGMMQPPQSPYNSYGPGQNMPSGYAQGPGGMYSSGTAQSMPGQYPNQNYMGQQGYGQFPKSDYIPQNQSPYDSSPYSSASPLQSMQQAVYGQPATSMSSQLGQMGPPPAPGQYAPISSPGGTMKPPVSSGGVRIQNIQTFSPAQIIGMPNQSGHGAGESQVLQPQGAMLGGQQMPSPNQIRMAGANISGPRPRMTSVRGTRPTIRHGLQVHGQIRGSKPVRMPMKRPGNAASSPVMKKRPNILLPGKHDNEDCQVMAMQKQREGLPLIQSVQGAKDKLNLGSQISITKKTVNKEASAMANVLASRGISIKQKQKSRSPSPDRPLPHIPNLGAGMSIKHTSKSSNFSIPESKVGKGIYSCKYCKNMFMSQNTLAMHMSSAHPQHKVPMFKCEECPASYPKILQLQHHKRVFHNVIGPNRELGLPVVDMSQEDNLKRLSNLGIYSFIPLASKEQSGGCFGIPVISVHNAQNGLTSSLQALGADGLLSLGPLKSLPNS